MIGDQKGQTQTAALKLLQPEPAQDILYPRREDAAILWCV